MECFLWKAVCSETGLYRLGRGQQKRAIVVPRWCPTSFCRRARVVTLPLSSTALGQEKASSRRYDGPAAQVVVHVANLQDREGVPLLLEPIKGIFPQMKKVWVDSGYTGQGREWIEQAMGWEGEVVRHAPRPRGMWVWPGMEITEEMLAVGLRPKGFRHLPRRWIGERTCAWIGRNRRMSKDYEYVPSSSESMVQLTMIRLMVRRLAGATETARENAQRRRAA